MTKSVLVFLRKGNKVCLARKKTGHGEGKWNGFGGKIEDEETSKQAAVRELFEESGVKITNKNLIKVAELYYIEESEWLVDVFVATEFDRAPSPSKEMEPRWFGLDHVPWEEMWFNDRLWLEKILNGKRIKATFWHDKEGNLLKHKFTALK